MKTDIETIKVNGVEYVRLDSCAKASPALCDDYFIVRTYSAGVFAGQIKSRQGAECVMVNARRLWYWKGAASLSQLATEGVKCPEECKFPCEVPEVTLTGVVEVLRCTEAAQESIKAVAVWEM